MLVQGLAIEEPEVTFVALRPGVVDTEMQSQIREMGSGAMNSSDYAKFVDKKESGTLLDAKVPAASIVKLALNANPALSGQFVNWDDNRIY
jgi:NAD(P)-dependent dehydrogenase (short-subunit alcohol dehydrogenase family)